MFDVTALCAGYGPLPILHDVSLTLNKEETPVLQGRNGVGKTTLLKALLVSPANTEFLSKYRAKYGPTALVNSIAKATYDAVWLYAKAVEAVGAAGTVETEAVINALGRAAFDAPQGAVRFDPTNQHMATNTIIGRCRADGLFDIIENPGPIHPVVTACSLG